MRRRTKTGNMRSNASGHPHRSEVAVFSFRSVLTARTLPPRSQVRNPHHLPLWKRRGPSSCGLCGRWGTRSSPWFRELPKMRPTRRYGQAPHAIELGALDQTLTRPYSNRRAAGSCCDCLTPRQATRHSPLQRTSLPRGPRSDRLGTLKSSRSPSQQGANLWFYHQ